jgi:AraC family transcriptional regulator of adaptative response / methylphosphotriester-DNA alkyltransferase methyltransferase
MSRRAQGRCVPRDHRAPDNSERVDVTQRAHTRQLRRSLYRDAVAIVEVEYASDLSIDQIARRVATSRRQLQRVYAEVGQTTFREQLTGIRMQRAADLLATRRISVREIAARVGYSQPAHFSKAYRRYHGVNPSAARPGAKARRAAQATLTP